SIVTFEEDVASSPSVKKLINSSNTNSLTKSSLSESKIEDATKYNIGSEIIIINSALRFTEIKLNILFAFRKEIINIPRTIATKKVLPVKMPPTAIINTLDQ